MNPIKLLLSLLLVLPLWKPSSSEGEVRTRKPKNVILLIGDGMGLSQLSSAYYNTSGEPSFSRFPVVGLIKTSSAREKITDSAAGATAFACGKKTYNGAIGVGVDSTELPGLLDHFEGQRKSSGLVATSSITHATPASFYAHAVSRHLHEDIASDMLEAPLQFFAGGGSKYFDSALSKKLKESGWIIESELQPMDWDGDDWHHAYLLAEDGMPKMSDGRGDFLRQATDLAISFLDRDKDGFFLMAEASQIDWGGHANDGDYIVKEVQDFERCIGAVLDFAEKDGETLVIVTADHETGGFTLAAKEKAVPFMRSKSDYNDIDMRFSTGGHSATMVPVLAYGPGSTEFAGIYENTEIYHKIVALTK